MDSHKDSADFTKLFVENELKIKNIFGKYFKENEDNNEIHSEWLLPKEKINYDSDNKYLSNHEIELFKNLGSNLIVTGKIKYIQYSEDRKINRIEVRLEQVVAICYGGEHLINQDFDFSPYYINNNNHKNGLDQDFIHYYRPFYENLYKYNIIGLIKKNEIYDNRLPHFNDDLVTNIKENNLITCLIIDNKINEIHDCQNIRRNEFIQLSIKNSIIRKSEQFFISHLNRSLKIPFLLGLNYGIKSNSWVYQNSSHDLMLKNSSLMNESLLNNIMADLNLFPFQFQNLNESTKLNDITGFSYEKIRKVQNYDWADDYIKKGRDMMEIKNYEKAIDYFRDAEKLDSLNKDIYIQKGDKLENAKKEFKNCLKIEHNDEMAVKYLTHIVKREKQNQVDLYEQMLSKKRKNE